MLTLPKSYAVKTKRPQGEDKVTKKQGYELGLLKWWWWKVESLKFSVANRGEFLAPGTWHLTPGTRHLLLGFTNHFLVLLHEPYDPRPVLCTTGRWVKQNAYGFKEKSNYIILAQAAELCDYHLSRMDALAGRNLAGIRGYYCGFVFLFHLRNPWSR